MKKHLSKKRVVLAAIVAVVLAISSGIAYAYWTSTGTGSLTSATASTSVPFTAALTGSAPSNLTPNEVDQSFVVTVTNPAGFAQTLSALEVSVAGPLGAVWASGTCNKDDFVITPPVVSKTAIASLGSANFTYKIHMVNSLTKDQNDCKSATIPLYFSAS